MFVHKVNTISEAGVGAIANPEANHLSYSSVPLDLVVRMNAQQFVPFFRVMSAHSLFFCTCMSCFVAWIFMDCLHFVHILSCIFSATFRRPFLKYKNMVHVGLASVLINVIKEIVLIFEMLLQGFYHHNNWTFYDYIGGRFLKKNALSVCQGCGGTISRK
jgi:hypothetical protein